MGRRDKKKKFQFDDDDDGDLPGGASKYANSPSSDEEEANEDLSLKIVEKALLLRSGKLVAGASGGKDDSRGTSGGDGDSGVGVVELYAAEGDAGAGTSVAGADGSSAGSGSKKSVRRRKKKGKNLGTEEHNVVVTEGEKTETTGTITDNNVFRKLLRGPRYFDPPDSWGTCYNCGEEGHNAVNCTSVKQRKKPCFVCGSLEHFGRSCSKARDCFICKKGGHRAKDCPEKHKDVSSSPKMCLKCGDPGHDMFSCQNDYPEDDLKNIQCYICKKFGHLCCVNSTNNTSIDISCYKCGQTGHTGLACSRLRGEASGAASSSSCYRCGEEGHFARECTSAKVSKRNREVSNPKLRSQIEEVNQLGSKSAPPDLAKVHKRKKINHEDKHTTLPRKSGQKGRWMMDDPATPGNFSSGTSKKKNWNSPVKPSRLGHNDSPVMRGYNNSPATPSMWAHNNYKEYTGHSHYEHPQSSAHRRALHPHPGTPTGPSKASYNRFPASRFGGYNNERFGGGGFNNERYGGGYYNERFGGFSNEGRRHNYGWM